MTDVDNIDLSKMKVKRDPSLSPHERETHIYFDDADEYTIVESDQVVWIKRLLKHAYFQIKRIWILDDAIVRVDGSIPKNCIRVSKKPRNRFDKM
ncbi:MAG TPA: hypothetical protein ENI49_04130 [Thermoplasmatales archaeon]|nr:hypothetical protein [Thermoplasmatales archaeon]